MVPFFPRFLFRRWTRALLARRAGRPLSAALSAVAADGWGISLGAAGAARQSLAWEAIDIIAIRIEEDMLPAPVWYIGNAATLLRISNTADGLTALFDGGFARHLAGYEAGAAGAVIAAAMARLSGLIF